MKSLIFTFQAADHKTKTLRVNAFAGDIDANQALAFMQAVADNPIVVRNGVPQYVTIVSAKAVTTNETPLFNNKKA
ncbi:DUF2922 domain-containing protein [Lacticaseibacillus brantae]|uniref:DUF2922 domain-containing protein n=1 Tax=Lacticaseibacillus brantae DSM 23927 TaxID=1423727 RepID=A0A0R2B7U6_9LACO|nr:DUF2922 domain-containing protein [Lacticaseibacillus brantae]KRM72425.1 hypothetical protein FC34_GL000128 [Lacticaseibacillus brantae DSM 23927]